VINSPHIRIYTDIRTESEIVPISYTDGDYASVALVRTGYIPSAPLVPTTAFKIELLELYRTLNKHHRRLGLQPFMRALLDFHGETLLTSSAYTFSKAFDCYLAIRREVQSKLDWALGRTAEDWRLKQVCPACTYELTDEPKLHYSLLCAADGNMSLRRFKKVGLADDSKFESSYFVDREDVERFAHVAQARRGLNKRPAKDLENEDDQDADLEAAGPNVTTKSLDSKGGQRPQTVDPLADMFSGLPSECAERWKANADDNKKVMWECFDECGIFVVVCRHGIVLLACDMIQSGEQ
jgi:Kyakuja-Dileera-Zisupton transposase/CxC1 like cysteine cluster associated with KDZ transposases